MTDQILAPGRIVLVQKPSHKYRNARAGSLFDVATESVIEGGLTGVALKVEEGRSYFPWNSKGKSDRTPACHSINGAVPAPNALAPQNKTCKGCRWNHWGSETSPQCKDKWELLFLPTDSAFPRWFRVPATATRSVRALLRRAQEDSYVSVSRGGRERHLWDYAFTVRPVKQRRGSRAFWTVEFTGWKYVEPLVSLLDASVSGRFDSQQNLYASATACLPDSVESTSVDELALEVPASSREPLYDL